LSFRAWAAFAALCVIWGIPYFLIKVAVVEVSPFVVAWARVALGACVLLPIAWKRGALRPARANLLPLIAFGCIELAMPFAAIALGEQWISSSLAGILIATVPLCVAIMSRAFGVHERLGRRRLIGLGLGFAGVVTLLGFGTVSGALGWIGVSCLVIAAIGYSIGPLIIQRYFRELDPIGSLAACLSIAALALLIPAIATFPSVWPGAATLAALGVLGVLCTAIAMLLMFYLVSHATAARASLITYINPAVASLLGVGLLHERLGPNALAAFPMILLGSWLGSRAAPAPKVETELSADR
jgi:drug/metabolite transporter (DMT)-like permease